MSNYFFLFYLLISQGTGRYCFRRCRGTEMAALLTTLNQLQFRFAPFLARYQAFMQDDPQVAEEVRFPINTLIFKFN